MAEAVGLTSSIIAIVELSAKIGKLCLDYSNAVSNARQDISRLHGQVDGLSKTLQEARRVIGGPEGQSLTTSQNLLDSLDGCTSELVELHKQLDLGKRAKAMRRFGLRALKWPFDMQEVVDIISRLERYERTIHLGLQVDQTALLLEMRQQMNDVSLQPGNSIGTKVKPCFIMPFEQDTHFVNRPEIMQWVKEQYEGHHSRMALVGMGGFGKSQIAIQFAHQTYSESPETSVFWVHASSKPRFQEAYRLIAERLQIPGRNKPQVNEMALVRDWLQREEVGSWLMILDNADDVNLFYPDIHVMESDASHSSPASSSHDLSKQQPLAAFLPKGSNGTILVTTRSLDVAEKLTGSHETIYKLSTMNDANSLQLFRNKLQDNFDQDTAGELLHALNYIPLAITQAAAYINRRAPRVTVRSYLDDFRKSEQKKGSLLNRDAGDLRRDESVSNSVVATWQVTFEQVRREKPSAADLLSFLSFFNSQGIPEFMARKYKTTTTNLREGNGEDEFDDDLDVLRGYSLVSVMAATDAFEMHPLVQFCTQSWLSSAGDIELWKNAYFESMATAFPSGEVETWPTCRLLQPHLESIVEGEPPQNDPISWVYLVGRCSYFMRNVGNYKGSEYLNRKELEASQRYLGSENIHTVECMEILAMMLLTQGQLKESEELQLKVLEISIREFGDEHPNTVRRRSNLAMVYKYQGRLEECEQLGSQIVEIRKRTLRSNHPDTLDSMHFLATVLAGKGQLKEAEEIESRVVEAAKDILGDDHANTLTYTGNLGLIYDKSGRWKEAEEIHRVLVEKWTMKRGAEHPTTMRAYTQLAMALWRQGFQIEGEEMQEMVLKNYRRTLGDDSPTTLICMGHLAWFWSCGSRLSDAVALIECCTAGFKRIYGENHRYTIWAMDIMDDLSSTLGGNSKE
ncbi:hypothetical protein BKA56DRAFT_513553 [Ilyonectria sp. MPI-CAGE-AT-0026]|nr:hypothetical protein BKA56DRAFT_513553 [Ilyonectria sp. MPI-CAGE-AT-0026]